MQQKVNTTKVVIVMQDTCFHLVFAGHDSSASALSMLLHYLKKEPWVMDKLRQEQSEVCPAVSQLYQNQVSVGEPVASLL